MDGGNRTHAVQQPPSHSSSLGKSAIEGNSHSQQALTKLTLWQAECWGLLLKRCRLDSLVQMTLSLRIIVFISSANINWAPVVQKVAARHCGYILWNFQSTRETPPTLPYEYREHHHCPRYESVFARATPHIESTFMINISTVWAAEGPGEPDKPYSIASKAARVSCAEHYALTVMYTSICYWLLHCADLFLFFVVLRVCPGYYYLTSTNILKF